MPKREVSSYIVRQIVGQGLVEATGNLMDSAKILGGLAKLLMDEEVDGTANPSQLIEAGARCIDVIELIVESTIPDDEKESYRQEWEESDTYEDLAQVRERLNRLRGKILGLTEEE